jgi:hypothetical protein
MLQQEDVIAPTELLLHRVNASCSHPAAYATLNLPTDTFSSFGTSKVGGLIFAAQGLLTDTREKEF